MAETTLESSKLQIGAEYQFEWLPNSRRSGLYLGAKPDVLGRQCENFIEHLPYEDGRDAYWFVRVFSDNVHIKGCKVHAPLSAVSSSIVTKSFTNIKGLQDLITNKKWKELLADS